MVARKVKTTLAITGVGSLVSLVVVACLSLGGACEETAEAGERTFEDRREQRRAAAQAERERFRAEFERREQASARRIEEMISKRPMPNVAPRPETKRNVRKVRRWVWESPAETRSKLWNVPRTEDSIATQTGLLRICMTEADGHEADCRAIWQVLNNIRSSGCDRGRIRRITECDEGGETILSVMRRAQKFALGIVPPRSARTRWITDLELDCEQPETFPGSSRQWESQYSRGCSKTVALVRGLVSGEDRGRGIRGRPIAWGGRCEARGGACDDPLACSRGLIRIQNDETLNAFWRRPSNPNEIEPVCRELGFGRETEGDEVVQADTPRPEVGAI
jgi:hypothetical protein